MLSVILTKPQKVLIVGAGKACAIKLKVLKKTSSDITIVSENFECDLSNITYTKIQQNFYTLKEEFFKEFDLIYIAIALKDTAMVEKLSVYKMINVLSNPNLSNFIHPCSRNDGDIQVSVHNLNKPNPKKACSWAEKFINFKFKENEK